MPIEKLLSCLNRAVSLRANIIHIAELQSFDQYAIQYRHSDLSNSECSTESGCNELFCAIESLAHDTDIFVGNLSDTVQSAELSQYSDIPGSRSAVLYVFEKEQGIYERSLDTKTRLTRFGYTEKQAQDLSDILHTQNGFLLFSGRNWELNATYKVLSLCKKHDFPHAELHLSRSLTEEYIRRSQDHLVLTSLCANSALALPREYLSCTLPKLPPISHIRGAIYQKRVPVLCDQCKIPFKEKTDILGEMRTILNEVCESLPESEIFFTGPGCEACCHTGIRSMTALAEVVKLTSEFMNFYTQDDRCTVQLRAMQKAFHAQGNLLFREICLQKMFAGQISPEHFESLCGLLPQVDDILAMISR